MSNFGVFFLAGVIVIIAVVLLDEFLEAYDEFMDGDDDES
jgi:hypothetical protein